MPETSSYQRWIGRKVVGADGSKIGKIDQIYVDERSHQPLWMAVHTGLFGARTSFVPLESASESGEEVTVPYTKETVKAAPPIEHEGRLEPTEQDALNRHYAGTSGGSGGGGTVQAPGPTGAPTAGQPPEAALGGAGTSERTGTAAPGGDPPLAGMGAGMAGGEADSVLAGSGAGEAESALAGSGVGMGAERSDDSPLDRSSSGLAEQGDAPLGGSGAGMAGGEADSALAGSGVGMAGERAESPLGGSGSGLGGERADESTLGSSGSGIPRQGPDPALDGSGPTWGSDSAPADSGTAGAGTDSAMTRSEEEMRVGTESVETGRARLTKSVETEQVETTVPVSHEEARIEREPITDANRQSATSGPEISESEHEVVLHEERPVVGKEVVPRERVRLTKDVVTEQRAVTGEIRKERIDVEGADMPEAAMPEADQLRSDPQLRPDERFGRDPQLRSDEQVAAGRQLRPDERFGRDPQLRPDERFGGDPQLRPDEQFASEEELHPNPALGPDRDLGSDQELDPDQES